MQRLLGPRLKKDDIRGSENLCVGISVGISVNAVGIGLGSAPRRLTVACDAGKACTAETACAAGMRGRGRGPEVREKWPFLFYI
jgi:hypothetical protein